MTFSKYQKYKIHIIYGIILVISILSVYDYMQWSQKHFSIENGKQNTEIENCMSNAEKEYDDSVAKLCRNSNDNCKVIIAYVAPKLLDPIINTLNRQQEICIKMASR